MWFVDINGKHHFIQATFMAKLNTVNREYTFVNIKYRTCIDHRVSTLYRHPMYIYIPLHEWQSVHGIMDREYRPCWYSLVPVTLFSSFFTSLLFITYKLINNKSPSFVLSFKIVQYLTLTGLLVIFLSSIDYPNL